MPSEQDNKTAEKAVPRGGRPPNGVKRVAVLPMGASGAAARSARLASSASFDTGGVKK